MQSANFKPITPNSEWIIGKYGLMNVHCQLRGEKTIIEPSNWRIPMQWQGYHYQNFDDQPYMLLLNSGGGFVEGDVSHLTVHMDDRTRALVTTTASSKFYKCLGGHKSTEIVDVHVGADCLFEFYPDEAIPFRSSRVERLNRFELQSSSRLFATDMISAGRVHYGNPEIFDFDSMYSELIITIYGRPVIIDRIVAISPSEIAAFHGLWKGCHHMATVYAYADDLPKGIEDAVSEQVANVEGTIAGASRIGNLIVARILAKETWQAHEAVYNAWQVLRPSLAYKEARPIRKC